MSRYKLPGDDPMQRVDVGWSRDYGYFYAVYEDDSPQPITLSEPGSLPSVHDLVEATWGVMTWQDHLDTLRRLRDDPWTERTSVSGRDAEVSAILSQAFMPSVH